MITEKTKLSELTVKDLRDIIQSEILGVSQNDRDLNKIEVMKDLRIGKTKYQELLKRRQYPIPMKGTPKKKFIKWSELQEWKSKYWGKY